MDYIVLALIIFAFMTFGFAIRAMFELDRQMKADALREEELGDALP